MPKEIKKRARVPSATANPVRKALQSRPQKRDAITKTIADSLKSATPETIRVFRETFTPLIEESLRPLHCSSNHKEACLVKCDGDPQWNQEGDEDDEDDGFYEAMCCGKTFNAYEDTDTVCFRTSHTTNPTEVEYQEGDKEDKKAGLNLKGSNDVATCRVNHCHSHPEMKQIFVTGPDPNVGSWTLSPHQCTIDSELHALVLLYKSVRPYRTMWRAAQQAQFPNIHNDVDRAALLEWDPRVLSVRSLSNPCTLFFFASGTKHPRERPDPYRTRSVVGSSKQYSSNNLPMASILIQIEL
ncbi:hypothetical protein BDV93DRAFT_594431 [Ceratobasidium sp. AG-I]|nr:hypothetical protein BDV93DRAFT_594431 [Ceratobasidium sp. AG-I]